MYYELFLKLSVSNASPEGRQVCSRYVEQVQNVFSGHLCSVCLLYAGGNPLPIIEGRK